MEGWSAFVADARSSRPPGIYRKPGVVVSGGQVAVNAARKLRKAAKLGNNVFLRAGMPVPTYAETLPLLPGGINAVPQGRCRGEGHGDLLSGRLFPDLKSCEWGLEYDNVT